MSFGKYLVNLRDKRGYSQRHLAQKANLSNTEISRLENDERKPSLQTLQKLSRALNEPLERMLQAANILSESKEKSLDLLDILENENIEITVAGKPISQTQRVRILEVIDNSEENNDDVNLADYLMASHLEGDDQMVKIDKDLESLIKSAIRFARKQTKKDSQD